MNKAFINAKEAAALLSVPVSTIRSEAAKPGCPVYRRTSTGPMQFDPVELVKWWKRSSV